MNDQSESQEQTDNIESTLEIPDTPAQNLPAEEKQEWVERTETGREEAYIGLRCNKCNKPIRAEDSVLTPTGYRCKECVSGQQKVFDNTKGLDVVFGFLISFMLALAGSFISQWLGIISLLAAPAVGFLIFILTRLAVKRRRSRALSRAILIGAILGVIPAVLISLVPIIFHRAVGVPPNQYLLDLIWTGYYSFVVPSSAYLHSKSGRTR
ncbi:MAG: hypothetical protein ACOYKD_04125 [Anaerolineaceae bacterium]|jgi:hypothetical protein